VIRLDRVTKTYQPSSRLLRVALRSSISEPITALDDLSLTVGRGEVCALVGPNGAGKSTVFRLLMGLVTPTSGSVHIAGLDPVDPSPDLRRLVGYGPADDRSLWLRHTCRENLEFFGRLHGLRAAQLDHAIDRVLDVVELGEADSRAVVALSNGMRARLQLARALLHSPEVLLLDEPTGALDPIAAWELLEVIRALAEQRRITVLISSHRLEAIEALQGNVLLLEHGRTAFRGDLAALAAGVPPMRIELTFEHTADAAGAEADLARLNGVTWVERTDGVVAVGTSLSAGALLSALHGRLESLRTVHSSTVPLTQLLAELSREHR
jgi:ABC-2 type transport system ATP-binding protein